MGSFKNRVSHWAECIAKLSSLKLSCAKSTPIIKDLFASFGVVDLDRVYKSLFANNWPQLSHLSGINNVLGWPVQLAVKLDFTSGLVERLPCTNKAVFWT